MKRIFTGRTTHKSKIYGIAVRIIGFRRHQVLEDKYQARDFYDRHLGGKVLGVSGCPGVQVHELADHLWYNISRTVARKHVEDTRCGGWSVTDTLPRGFPGFHEIQP